MLSYDYFYILPPSVVPPSFGNTTKNDAIKELYGEVARGSPLDKLLSGMCGNCSDANFLVLFHDGGSALGNSHHSNNMPHFLYSFMY